ncbi:TonB-dependent receptor [Ectothiorhodospira sp. A-7Y]|nr:TonB-dependent receptor [Ectothiorhodospira lacustris]MCG5511192.1 TonB-dependent receptor [Ectothiorhodospira lacustris]MCG5522856.1 TonB-dependent receptor [Ectothiorhodospira lacustris]
MPHFRRCAYAIGITLLGTTPQAPADNAMPIYELGTIHVAPQRQELGGMPTDQASSVLTLHEFRHFNRNTVGQALDLLPGIHVSTNSRNEQVVHVRGFDARQIPLFIDGIPVYVPYDGYIDFNRFTTADLAAIQVAKGFSSVVYGPNTLGGAINLVSRKPQQRFEGNITLGAGQGNERSTAVNVGSHQGNWYVQGGYAWIDSDGFRLSSDFTSTPTESGGLRENAYRKDEKLSLKIGLQPNATDEYALSYYQQNGEKGQPPSTDPNAARYWQWPYWDKESLYFISSTAVSEYETIKTRLYRDAYDNAVHSYTDDTYSQLRTGGRGSVGPAGKSIYNDRTTGGAVELHSARLPRQAVTLVAMRKQDEHKANNTLMLTEHFEDTLTSLGVENTIQLAQDLRLSLGLSRHELQADRVFKSSDPVPKPDAISATNAQLGLFWDLDPLHRVYASLSGNSRFPTLKDRYSLRLGSAIPNPDLQKERSLNAELGYQGSLWPLARLEAAVFMSEVTDLIQRVDDVEPGRYQMQNVGEVRIKGLELALSSNVGPRWRLGGNLTLLDRDNRSDPDTRLTGVPERKLLLHGTYTPSAPWEILLVLKNESSRWDSDTIRLSGHTTADLGLAFEPFPQLRLEARVDNLFDEDYEVSSGFPSPGRMWFFNARYEF